MSAASRPLVFALHDSLMLLAPPGWTRVELGVAQTPHGLRLTQLETRGDGAKDPRPRPNLFFEPREEAERFGEALTELAASLEGRWTPGRVLVERPQPDFADWKFLRDDGSVAWFTRLDKAELGSLLITDALFDAVQGTERAFHDLQAQLQQRLGRVTGFAFDAAHGVLRLDRPSGSIELRAQVVGSYLPELFTWVWSWSDEHAQDASSGQVRRACQPELKPEGLAAFWRAHFHCDEGFAWALAGHVAVSIAARGIFRAHPPEGEGALFFAVLELPA
ncbi:MAG: DUF6882 domain-containing protein [Myxococcota bacterium]